MVKFIISKNVLIYYTIFIMVVWLQYFRLLCLLKDIS